MTNHGIRVRLWVAAHLSLVGAIGSMSHSGCAQAPAESAPTAVAAAPGQVASDDPFGKDAGVIKYGRASVPAKAAGSIRLAAYNVENLFDDKDDPTLSGRYDDLGLTTTDGQCRNVAAAIKALDADVMILEEVESEEALRWFRDTYLKDLGYDHIKSFDAGYERGVEQSVLSRFPIKDAKVFAGERIDDMAARRVGGGWTAARAGHEPDLFGRNPIRAVIDGPGDYELILYGVHLKAGGGDDSAAQREAESLQVREFVKADLAANPNANVAVLGDFNATPLQRAYALQLKGNAEKGDGAGVGIGAYDFRDRTRPMDEYRTHVSARTIDYIVMSEGLAADAVEGTFVVLGTPFPGEEQQKRVLAWIKKGYPRGEEPVRHPQQASDHYPIAIDLDPSKDVPVALAPAGSTASPESGPTPAVPPKAAD